MVSGRLFVWSIHFLDLKRKSLINSIQVPDTLKHISFLVQGRFCLPILDHFIYCLTTLLIIIIHNFYMLDKLEYFECLILNMYCGWGNRNNKRSCCPSCVGRLRSKFQTPQPPWVLFCLLSSTLKAHVSVSDSSPHTTAYRVRLSPRKELRRL